MTSLTFTPLVPTLGGVAFTMTSVVSEELSEDAGKYKVADEYVYVPINDVMRTVVVITNSDASEHTVTFTSQKDQWGNSGACMDKVITVKGNKTVITGVWLRDRWGEKDSPDTGDYTCTVSYDVAADISIAVINVPNASL